MDFFPWWSYFCEQEELEENKEGNMSRSIKEKARDEIVYFIALKYINLSNELDSCQGATENLEEKFTVMRYYENLIKNLTGLKNVNVFSLAEELENKGWQDE